MPITPITTSGDLLSRVRETVITAPPILGESPMDVARSAVQARVPASEALSAALSAPERAAAREALDGRMRASAARRKASRAAATAAPQPPHDERLGTLVTDFPPPASRQGRAGALTSTDAVRAGVADVVRNDRQKDRFASRRLLWRISTLKAVRCCGRAVIDHSRGVLLKVRDGRSYVDGVTRCKSIWACPVCAAKIRAERAVDISKAVAKHVRAGGTAYLVTLTARHHRRHRLADLMAAITEAFEALVSGSQWAGDRKRGKVGERDRLGVVGIIRSTEVTYGTRNGWHPHLHLVVLMGAVQKPRPELPRKADRPAGWVRPEWDARPTGYFAVPDPSEALTGPQTEALGKAQADLRRMQARWERMWLAWLEKHGFRPNRDHAVKWDRITTEKSAEAIGEYVAKTQDGKSIGNELARFDMKSGRAVGNETPFEMLRRYRDLTSMTAEEAEGIDVPALLAAIEGAIAEYETATRGRRAIEWSRHLRAALEMGEELTDDEVIDADAEGLPYAALDVDAWRRICRLGLDYEIHARFNDGGFAALVLFLTELELALTPFGPGLDGGALPAPAA
jgi:hypothetical protein